MRYVDAPIRRALGRTPRELLLLATGALMVVHSFQVHDTSWNAPVTAIVTAMFAARFFAARVAGLALCTGALALCATGVIDPQEHVRALAPAIAQFAAGFVLLASRDLRARFDDGGRGLGPLRNFWRDIPTADRRSIARVVCAGTATAALLHHASHGAAAWGPPFVPPGWLFELVLLASLGGVLLIAGRGAGFVVAAAFSALALAKLAPLWHDARAARGGVPDAHLAEWLRISGSFVVVATVTAAATLAFTLPWLARLARRAAD
jgi:hypothetical protein